MSSQLSFLPPPEKEHGGSLSKGKRKIARPIVTKRPMHFVMRSDGAVGRRSLLRKENATRVRARMKTYSALFGVRIYEWGNGGNHLHFLLRAKTRAGLKGFVRALSGSLAMAITGARKGNKLAKRFWTLLAYSRVVEWGRDERCVRNYVLEHGTGISAKGNLEIFRTAFG